MPGPLQKPEQFRRGRRDEGLPGQTGPGDDLGLGVTLKVYDRPTATIFEKELIQMGAIGAGRYLEISEDGVRFYLGSNLVMDLQTDGTIVVGYVSGGEYVKVTATGLELYSGGTKLADIQSDGDMFLGDVGSGDYVKVSSAGVEQWVGGTKLVDVQTGDVIYVGSSSGGEYVKITSAGIEMYSGGTRQVDAQSDGDVFIGDVGSGDYVKISSAGVEQWVGGVKLVDVQTGDDIYVGNVSGGEYVKITSSGVEMYSNAKRKVDIESDGDIFIGDDLSSAGGTYFSIFSGAQTYNGESVAAGDMIIGDNSSSKANILWDKSQGRLKFRGGTTTELYIDTDGSLVAGNGDVILDSDGIALAAGTGTPNKVKVMDGSDIIMHLYGNVDAGSSQIELIAEGKDSGDPDAILTLQAITYNGSAQNYVQCDTNNDVVVASATTLRGFKVCRLTGITTTTRNGLSAVNGMIIYNSTTNTFQGRAGGAWVDLH